MMKTILKSCMIIFLVLSVLSCKKSGIEHRIAFQESYLKWMQFKKTADDSYQYQVVFHSWTGYGTQTNLTIRKGKVVRREFRMLLTPDYPVSVPDDEKAWIEEENETGIHENGAAPITIDAVYETARTNWLKARKDSRTYFETDNNGLVSYCGYTDKNCADDCFVGIHITFIRKL